MSLAHALDYLVEALNLVSIVLIWIPAFKVARTLKTMNALAKVATANNGELGELATHLKQDIARTLTEFSPGDLRMLLGGILMTLLMSLIKIFSLIPISHS